MSRGARLVIAAAAVVAAGAAAAAPRPLVIGSATPARHDATLATQQFADTLAEATRGALEVEHHHSGSRGSDRDLLRGVQAGTLDLTPVATAVLAPLVPEIAVFHLPYLVRDHAHLVAALDGEAVRAYYAARLERRGLRLVAFFAAGSRLLYGITPVNTPADLQGKPIRVQDDRTTIATFVALGMTPLPLPAPEVTLAFRAGTIAFAEGGLAAYQRARHVEVAKHVADVRHAHHVVVLVMAKAAWARLDATARKAVTDSARVAERWNRRVVGDQDRALQEQLRARGAGITKPDRAPFRAAVRGVWEEFFATPAGKDARRIVDHVLAIP